MALNQSSDTISKFFTSLDVVQPHGEFPDQMEQVKGILHGEKLIESSRVEAEVNWFFSRLGLDSDYFRTTPAPIVAKHILSLYAAKMVSHATGARLQVKLNNKTEKSALFVIASNPGKKDSPALEIEHLIETSYLGEGYGHGMAPVTGVSTPVPATMPLTTVATPTGPAKAEVPFRVSCYRTTGTVSAQSPTQLRLYSVTAPVFQPNADPNETDLTKISDVHFITNASPATVSLYQDVMKEVVSRLGPVIRVLPGKEDTYRLVVAYRHGTTHSFFSAITDLYHFHQMHSTNKYVEQFSNGITIFSVYLRSIEGAAGNFEQRVRNLAEHVSLVYVLPRTSLTPLFQAHTLSAQEVAFAYVGWKFAYTFLNRYSTEYAALASALGDDPAKQALLAQLKTRLVKDTFTEARVLEAVKNNTDLIKELYADFASIHIGEKATQKFDKAHNADLATKIKRTVLNELDCQVLTAILNFNRHLLKTNFFKPTKTALSFRLDPGFLSRSEYPNTPFGLFFIVGSEFRGFHIRFRDIARGGIRVIRSPNLTAYDHNAASLFDENYNLASTQQSKNKDIPEGGSKGTVLMSLEHQNKSEVAFRKYVDALLDVLLTKNSGVVDYYGKDEILFLGPDEGTADYMNWASQHARDRGAHFWKAFTTGKSTSRGGIPHDLYGMTTRSIHQYVLGTLEKLGLDEAACTKFQTGGPDGDLGSNEIKISKDKTIGIVDGSGVLYDPAGLDKAELMRLAEARAMARQFDTKKIGKGGFFVDINNSDVTLPDGSKVDNGMVFRNNFHLHPLSAADVFVPCGGRPEAVQLSNVDKLINPKTGEARYKVIVEGANLFFTQKARLILEEKGVIIFKDSSANKGGVTSSSLEVLAALAMTDEEFKSRMQVTDPSSPPPFYQSYVKEVHRIIEENARAEFECVWREYERTKTPRAIISDLISTKINDLNDQIQNSPLWDNQSLRSRVLTAACPRNLLELVGLSALQQRVPEPYVRAMFGAYLASRFVYSAGLGSPEFAFFTFINEFLSEK
eukprot:TRINITY_DN521_c0_g2_i3.p1 TRINITY_DN521_c0_g2~~TRINITY_DN521_c0_g2_i3.p1  ORF type:complete len:1046 (+),score=339.58 TRINITY_DN521_c0_g2_i3:67-3138(+)